MLQKRIDSFTRRILQRSSRLLSNADKHIHLYTRRHTFMYLIHNITFGTQTLPVLLCLMLLQITVRQNYLISTSQVDVYNPKHIPKSHLMHSNTVSSKGDTDRRRGDTESTKRGYGCPQRGTEPHASEQKWLTAAEFEGGTSRIQFRLGIEGRHIHLAVTVYRMTI